MSVRNAIVLLLALSTISLLAACGGSSPKATPPPSGGYSDSNLNGTYVFSLSGTDITGGSTSFFAMTGTLTASGAGGFSSGTVDLVDPALASAVSATTAVFTGLPTTGSYKITADGRGNGTITVAVNGQKLAIGLDFVLTSNSHGLITRFDDNGTGSGTIDLQGSGPTLGSAYVFSLSGTDPSSNPFGAAGNFAVGGSGTITGLEDFNDFKNPLPNAPLGGTVTLTTATFTATGSPYGTQFDVWPIDSTHLKLIETDGVDYLAGDAFTQATAISAGQLVYTMAGYDSSSFLLSAGGYLSYDGSSSISAGFEDINDSGSAAQSQTVSGSLSPAGTGRYVLVLGSFYNGVSGGTGTYTFAAYPSSSGILLLEIDSSGVSGGTAFAQSATTFGTSLGYGLNLSGANSGGEVDDIAEFTANSGGTLSNGLIDENDQGATAFDQKLGSGGTYTFDSSGSGRGVLSYPATDTTLIGTLNLVYYVAGSSNIIFIDGDSQQVGVGLFETQSSSASAAAAHTLSHFAALHAAAQHHNEKKQ